METTPKDTLTLDIFALHREQAGGSVKRIFPQESIKYQLSDRISVFIHERKSPDLYAMEIFLQITVAC